MLDHLAYRAFVAGVDRERSSELHRFVTFTLIQIGRNNAAAAGCEDLNQYLSTPPAPTISAVSPKRRAARRLA